MNNNKECFGHDVIFTDNVNNIYGGTLQECRKIEGDHGSWSPNGYCSEQGGGVHQICFDVNSKNKNFARDTNQGVNWSLDRQNKNHCMCLGAFALYKTKQKNGIEMQDGKKIVSDNELICNAIPETVFNENYVSSWNTWNGHEIENQAIVGLEELVDQCYNKNIDSQSKEYLKTKYCNLVNSKDELKSEFSDNFCAERFTNTVEETPDVDSVEETPDVDSVEETPDVDLTFLKNNGDKKMKDIIGSTEYISYDKLLKVTQKHCANMRFSKSISTSKLPILDKDGENPKHLYVSVCCTSDYCEMLENTFYYLLKDGVYYLLKRKTNKITQVVSEEYDDDAMFPFLTEKKAREICHVD
jgi:hypothetical protein